MKLSRSQIIEILSEKYYKFLVSLPYEDELYMKGIHEGKGKFLANLHIYLSTKDLPKKRNDKRFATDFITPKALEVLKKGSTTGLEYEHLIPKKKYIQDICEQKAKEGTLTPEFVKELLNRYLWTATVTTEEHKLLSRQIMPADWDGEKITARYDAAGIPLLKHHQNLLQ